jgi:methionyl-tRNA formyltransferase
VNRARVAFMGSPAFAVPSLHEVTRRCQVMLVVTQPDRPAGRGRRLEPTAVKCAASELGLPLCTYERGQRRELEARLADLALDLVVVVAFGHILKPSTLDLARHGAINVHASLLPRWRGVAPIERAMLAGDTTTGISLMRIDAGIDTGPVLARVPEAILAEDTRVTLTARLAERGAAALGSVVEEYLAGRLQPVPQDDMGACYAARLEKEEGRIHWQRDAVSLWNQVRGLYEWPGAFTSLAGQVLKVHAAEPASVPTGKPPGTIVEADARGNVWVACGAGRLGLCEVQLAGKPRVAAAALVRGRVLQAGMRLGD